MSGNTSVQHRTNAMPHDNSLSTKALPKDTLNGPTQAATVVQGGTPERAPSPTRQPDRRFIARLLHHTILPTFLLAFCPNLMICLWYTSVKCNGSYVVLADMFRQKSFVGGIATMWGDVTIPDRFTFGLISGYICWAILLLKVLPGSCVNGPVTRMGNMPLYKDNGFLYYIVTVVSFLVSIPVLKSYGYSPSIVYDKFNDVITALCVASYVFCAFLYVKGMYFPTTTDSGSSGNPIFDYYWGTELHPRILGCDVKQLTNCRFGMMAWGLLVMINALKSYELHGFVDSMLVTTVLQMLYITKFFTWEVGYLRTIDIVLDRAGFYICWGCTVYVPGLYASVSMYLVSHPIHLGPVIASGLISVGIISLYLNYMADVQKLQVRATNGNCLVWGQPPQIIRAKYHLASGEVRESILLVSGWWGLSRHFHYVPELMLATCWSVPALATNLMPYTYLAHLTILLVHRTYRDDRNCLLKYGKYWEEYCRRVPARIVPGIY